MKNLLKIELIEKGRIAHSRSNELDPTQERGDIRILLRHARFVRPYPLVQPRHQVHVIRDPPRQLLRRVHVCIYEP